MHDSDNLREKGKEYAQQLVISSQCLSCGITFSEKFSWYKEQEFNCPECGGPIDDTPIIEFAQNAIRRLQEMKNNPPENHNN